MRPIGTAPDLKRRSYGSSTRIAPPSLVKPGHSALTLTCGASSVARYRVSIQSAALLTPYGAIVGAGRWPGALLGRNPDRETRLMLLPPRPAASISRASARESRIGASRFVSNTFSHVPSDTS